MLRGNPPPPPPPNILFFSISFPSPFKKKSKNFGGGGVELPKPPLKYVLVSRNLISNEPIDHKIGLNVVVHVRKA